MQQNTQPRGRLRRTVDELIIAEMFLLYATIESAGAISDGLGQLGRQLTTGELPGDTPADSLRDTLKKVAGEATEPYSSRFNYLRDRLRDN
jgi:hypothetical protein